MEKNIDKIRNRWGEMKQKTIKKFNNYARISHRKNVAIEIEDPDLLVES